MIDPKQVTAVVVTTGEAPLGEVLASLSCFGRTIVYDNSTLEDHGVFGRYRAILDHAGVVYTQDDDCVLLNPGEICRFYDPALVTCNMPSANRSRYQGQDGMALVGYGAIFHTALVHSAFDRYSTRFPHDALFKRECDRVFTALNPTKWVALPLRHLPAATAPTRLHQQEYHEEAFAAIRQRVRALRQPRQASEGTAPAVSAITIFKDAGPFLREAIESVFAQTYDDWELLLVDDGSTDSSSEIALEYAGAFPEKVRYLEHPHHQNRGKSASRNLGLRHARGRYIAYLDADDVWLPQKLDRQIAILESQPAAAMVCGRSVHWDESVAANDQAPRYHDVLSIAPEQLVKPPLLATATLGLQDVWPSWAGSLIRREAIERLGGSDERFRNVYEHGVLFAKIFLSEPVYLSAECVGKYRIHPKMGSVVAAASGVWNPNWPNPAHHAYLAWLADYIEEVGLGDAALRSRLRQELRPYRYPRIWTYAKRMASWSRALGESVDNARRTVVRRIRGRSCGWIRAVPNPILEYCGGEVATIRWAASGALETEVRLESASGQLFSRSGSSGEAVTGPWLHEGLRLVLCDATNNGNEGDRELATVTVRTLGSARAANIEALGIGATCGAASSNSGSVTPTPSGTIRATPNPIPKLSVSPCQTTLSWTSEQTDAVEVHVGAPDGPLFSRSGPSGTATTGNWLTDGMTFFLQNVSGNRPLTREHTLARVSVNLAPVGSLDLAETVRLRQLPRFEAATTTLLGRPFRILDGATFIYMHREIIEEAIYYFQPATEEPYIIDGGANIGVSVLFFKHIYPRARVVVFEPDADAFAVLCENVQARALDDVTVVNAALADVDGTVAFVQQGAYASRIAAGNDAATAEVRTVRLRSALDRRVDLLKLNIEGAETAVIADCADLLDRVDRVVLEYHSLVGEPQTLHRLLAMLADAGFRVYVRSSRTEFMHPLIGFQVHSGMDCQLYVYAIRQ